MINALKLEVFCSLAETLNFTATAKRMFVSQQTVSRLISELEAEIGFALFERSSRKVALTPAGERYRDLIVDALWNYKRGLEQITSDFGGESVLRVDVQLYLDIGAGGRNAMDRLRECATVNSAPPSRLSPHILLDNLHNHKSDVAIMLERFFEPDESLRAKPLFQSDYLLLVSSRLANAPGFAPESLYHMPLIFDALTSESPESCERRCNKEIAALELSPPFIRWAPNSDSAYSLAEISDLLGVVISSSMDRVGFGHDLIGFPTGKTCPIIAVSRADETNPLVELYISKLADSYTDYNRSFQAATKPFYFGSSNFPES